MWPSRTTATPCCDPFVKPVDAAALQSLLSAVG